MGVRPRRGRPTEMTDQPANATARLADAGAAGAAQCSAAPPEHKSYDPAFFSRLFAIEDKHFWFRTRNEVIGALVRQITSGFPPGYRALEVGCGTGNVLRVLGEVCRDGHVLGMDMFLEGLRYARTRTAVPLVQGDMRRPPFGPVFSLVGLFDVLEHIPDDVQALGSFHAMLERGGALFLTVPAHPSLWSYFDEASCHFRRYTMKELEEKLKGAGFRVEFLTYYMASTLPLVWLQRKLAALAPRRGASAEAHTDELAYQDLRIVPVLNGLLTFLLSQETRLLARRRRLPLGSSLLAVARKA